MAVLSFNEGTARARVNDPLQGYPFWLVDVSPTLNYPFFALNPLLGFSSVSSPELNVEHQPYRPVNSMYPRHFARAATTAPITLRRAARFTSQDFYRWVDRHINGTDHSRRNLLLIHFTGLGVAGVGTANVGPFVIGAPFSETIRLPGRAWVLWNCVPTRYNAGEMDAKSGEVTLSELTVQPERMTEAALGVVA